MEMMPHLKALMDDLFTMAKGIVIKRTDIADKYENLNIIRQSDYFILATGGVDTFDTYISYPNSVLASAGLSSTQIIAAGRSKYNIPVNMRDAVVIAMRTYILANYVEQNNYYRELNGLPNVDDTNYVYVTDTISGIDSTMPVHKMTTDQIILLRSLGVIDTLISQFPTKSYLNFLGEKKINIITARQADRFSILQLGTPTNPTNESILKTNYELARRYIVYTHYLYETFGGQEHYDAYIGMRILSEAITYCISQNADIINTKSYTDLQTCKYILASYGLDIFGSMPFKYQKSIADNIQLLIKYKGTDEVYNKIYKIFGFNKSDVYRYYVTKSINRDSSGNPIINSDPSVMYKLGMSQVLVNSSNIALDIRNPDNMLDYDSIVSKDPYWGVYDTPDEVKAKLYAYDFNYFATEYISINTAYDITKMNFEINYVMSSLLAYRNNENNINVVVSGLTSAISLFDTFVYLFALLSKQYGFNGDIPSTMAGVASTYRFNFEANLTDLQNIYNQYNSTTQNYIPINSVNFTSPTVPVSNSTQLLNYYFNNVNVYNSLVNALNNANTKDQYMLVKQLLTYYTTSKQTTSIYTKSDGTVATTYLDYLTTNQPNLAYIINSISSTDIADKINEVLDEIDVVVNSDKLNYMFSRIPMNDDNVIKKYLSTVINVFKSYTVELHSLNMVYTIDDETNNKIRMMDEHYSTEESYSNEPTNICSNLQIDESTNMSDTMRIYDEINIEIIRGGIAYEF